MLILALSGDALIAFTHHSTWGEPLLVAAGIVAGARSITAFLKGIEKRKRAAKPRPQTTPQVEEPSAADLPSV